MIGEKRARVQPDDLRFDASSLQRAIFNSENFSSIATDARGVIQIFNVGAERMLGYAAAEVTNRITPAEIRRDYGKTLRRLGFDIEVASDGEPDFVKLDMFLIRGVDSSPRKRSVVQVMALPGLEERRVATRMCFEWGRRWKRFHS